jgi:hypothetical protein
LRKPDARTFAQDLMRGEHLVGGGGALKHKASAIPGGGTRPNSAYKFKGADGKYRTQKESASLNGMLHGTSIDAYRRTGDDASAAAASGTSIFDPVLCELAYRWFCPPAGLVLDPFAGGSVRGIVASKLGRQYVGVDLSARQIAANREQADAICTEPVPVWHEGDSRGVGKVVGAGTAADFVFSCPPYGNLERYSDDERDLSTLEYPAFLASYREVIAGACALLKKDRFACFVVGDVRDAKGFYHGFPADTIRAFEAAGLRLYNQAILVTAAGSLPIRAGKQFAATRKLGTTHQQVLVFCKGDPRRATKAIGEVEFGEFDPDAGASGEA